MGPFTADRLSLCTPNTKLENADQCAMDSECLFAKQVDRQSLHVTYVLWLVIKEGFNDW